MVDCLADKGSRGSRIGCTKRHCTTLSIYPVLVLCAVKSVCNIYNTWSPGEMNCTYIAMEKVSLSCTDWACNKRGAEVYASFKLKSQSNRFDSQGWHLIICTTSQVKFRAKFRTSVWTECHDTSVYLLHNMPYEHVMFNSVKNNCTLT